MVTAAPLRPRGVLCRLGRFARDHRGVAALEFALILPFMLLLYIGGGEISTALTISRKVTHVTSTVADLVAQAKTISDADIAAIMLAANAIMEPYDVGGIKIRVTLIKIDGAGVTTVAWSDANANYTALTAGAAIVIPASVKVNGTYLVSAEIHYPYTPTIGYNLTGTFDLNDQFYLSPRLSVDVKRPPNYQ